MDPLFLTFSSSAAWVNKREGLLFLRYERRLPLAMKGITMEGVWLASKATPIRVITWGWWKSCIFKISPIMPERSFIVKRPKGALHLMKEALPPQRLHLSMSWQPPVEVQSLCSDAGDVPCTPLQIPLFPQVHEVKAKWNMLNRRRGVTFSNCVQHMDLITGDDSPCVLTHKIWFILTSNNWWWAFGMCGIKIILVFVDTFNLHNYAWQYINII